MSIRIALCDDMPVQIEMLEDMITEYAEESEQQLEIVSYDSGEKLLKDVDAGMQSDIYILDMIMPGIKGIELGKHLRERGDRGKIIYLTATAEYAVDSYKVGAFFYLLKPIGRATLADVLDRAIRDLIRERLQAGIDSSRGVRLVLKTKSGPVSVRSDDILYVDIVNRATAYHMMDGTVYMGHMLRVPFADAVAELLSVDDGMFPAGTHLVINLRRVEYADRNVVSFAGGEVLRPTQSACRMILEHMCQGAG